MIVQYINIEVAKENSSVDTKIILLKHFSKSIISISQSISIRYLLYFMYLENTLNNVAGLFFLHFLWTFLDKKVVFCLLAAPFLLEKSFLKFPRTLLSFQNFSLCLQNRNYVKFENNFFCVCSPLNEIF